jgi:hypothetical protein
LARRRSAASGAPRPRRRWSTAPARVVGAPRRSSAYDGPTRRATAPDSRLRLARPNVRAPPAPRRQAAISRGLGPGDSTSSPSRGWPCLEMTPGHPHATDGVAVLRLGLTPVRMEMLRPVPGMRRIALDPARPRVRPGRGVCVSRFWPPPRAQPNLIDGGGPAAGIEVQADRRASRLFQDFDDLLDAVPLGTGPGARLRSRIWPSRPGSGSARRCGAGIPADGRRSASRWWRASQGRRRGVRRRLASVATYSTPFRTRAVAEDRGNRFWSRPALGRGWRGSRPRCPTVADPICVSGGNRLRSLNPSTWYRSAASTPPRRPRVDSCCRGGGGGGDVVDPRPRPHERPVAGLSRERIPFPCGP